MPHYEYECQKCEHVTEVFHAMTARPRVKCPECGGRMRKLLGTGAGVIFKGSGFYETDYRSAAYKEKAKSETPGGAGESAASSDGKAKGDSTAAATSDGAAASTAKSKSGSNGSS